MQGGHTIGLRVVARFAACLTVCAWSIPTNAAESPWEFAPYQVQVWTFASPVGEPCLNRWQTEVKSRLESLLWAPWELSLPKPPAPLAARMARDFERLTAAEVQASAELTGVDKVFLVDFAWHPEGWRVRVREFDCRLERLGPVQQRTLASAAYVSQACVDLVCQAFVPLVRMAPPKGDEVQLSLRAGGLIVSPTSPAAVKPGDLFQPTVRQNDRRGKARAGGIRVVPWTFVQIKTEATPKLQGTLISGARSSLGGRGSSRNERLAALVRPQGTFTELRLKTLDLPALPAKGDRAAIPARPGKPLVGYQIVERQTPGGPLLPLGQTDWRGMFRVERSDRPYRELFVSNGDLPLAKLPIVPGLQAVETAVMNDDDPRIAAEGFILALQGRILDVLAQRTQLVLRAQRQAEAGKAAEAEQLRAQLRKLPSRQDLGRELDLGRQRLQVPAGPVADKIDKLFQEARKQIDTFLVEGESQPIPSATEAPAA